MLDMNTPARERYVLRHLALIDMERVQRSLEYLRSTTDEHLRDALFRDAVVSYAKPFSDNKGVHTKKGMRLSEKVIPKELKAAHKEVIEIRNQLFAHMDLDRQMPRLDIHNINGEKHVSFTVAGYGKVYAEHLIGPLTQLAQAVHRNLIEERREIERHV